MRGVTITRFERALEADGQPHVAVVEERVGLEAELVRPVDAGAEPEHRHLRDAEAGRERDLDEVEAQRRRDVEAGVEVVHVVEAPEQRDAVVGAVPPVEARVEQQEGERPLERRRQRDPAEEAERPVGGEAQRPQHQRPHRRGGDAERDRRHQQVDGEAGEQRGARPAQRPPPLGEEEQQRHEGENGGEGQGPHGVLRRR